jgi:hypothetical protein
MTSIKFNRVAKLSSTARFPRTFRARLANIPEQLKASLTAAQIAAIIDGPMQASNAAGHDTGYKDAQ